MLRSRPKAEELDSSSSSEKECLYTASKRLHSEKADNVTDLENNSNNNDFEFDEPIPSKRRKTNTCLPKAIYGLIITETEYDVQYLMSMKATRLWRRNVRTTREDRKSEFRRDLLLSLRPYSRYPTTGGFTAKRHNVPMNKKEILAG
ncbi:hypothetical protein G5I_04761 [Acromyrmex echinatior]|uniref:Uncharacterized protein n=1 Tax=Acromyrmex echinatior TaxID=103372 RepID=F4WGI2_ACREC|nr:hypothetical protein G5I_04761 [Acromyrmex echinatior]